MRKTNLDFRNPTQKTGEFRFIELTHDSRNLRYVKASSLVSSKLPEYSKNILRNFGRFFSTKNKSDRN